MDVQEKEHIREIVKEVLRETGLTMNGDPQEARDVERDRIWLRKMRTRCENMEKYIGRFFVILAASLVGWVIKIKFF